MKKFTLILIILVVSSNIIAQDKKKNLTIEQAANSKADSSYSNDVVVTDIPSATPIVKQTPKQEPKLVAGNLFVTNWAINYHLLNLPSYSLGAGMIFPLSNSIAIETGLSIVNSKVKENAIYSKYKDLYKVIGGSLTFSNVDLTIKLFPTKIFWIGFGFIYETLLDGYLNAYSVNAATPSDPEYHITLTENDEPSKLAVKFGFGLLSPIGGENYASPSIYVRYNLPLKMKFAQSDIYIGVMFSLAMKMGENKK